MDVQPKSEVRRPYRLKERARRQEETRRRITEAAIELHGTVGAARTTITAIAERAGVERLTVYRHFPDVGSLLEACSAHWRATHPPPDPSSWATIEDPPQRLRVALRRIYDYYESNEQMLANNLRDAAEIPTLAELMGAFAAYQDGVRSTLRRGWPVRGRRRARLEAALGHALDFETWRSLARRRGLAAPAAVDLMVRLAVAAAE